MHRFCLIGPTYPYRGGIAHYTTLLARELRKDNETLLISFSRQYPRFLFPGRSDRDPSQQPLREEAEYLLDPLNPLTWRRTVRRVDQWQAEVVIIPWWVSYWAPAWSVIGRCIKRLKKRPKLVFVCHNVLPHEDSAVDRLAARAALAPAGGFIVHGRNDAEQLREIFPRANIRVTPHPTYAPLGEASAVPPPVSLPDDQPVILFCGFVRPYKGLDILLAAMPGVLARRDVRLLVAGEFWESEKEYRAQIGRLGIEEQVTIVDRYMTNEELTACIQAADVVVLPYRSATQSGIVQLAYGLGRSVITTDVGGLPDVVDDGRTGLIVPAEDPEALAVAIDRYFAEDLRPVFESNIAEQSARFEWRRLVEEIEALI
jgi:glycosyltransferase involved in cell wall biosynthesis